MEFSQPNELGYSVHSDAWFLHFNRSVLSIKVQQEEEEIRGRFSPGVYEPEGFTTR